MNKENITVSIGKRILSEANDLKRTIKIRECQRRGESKAHEARLVTQKLTADGLFENLNLKRKNKMP